MKYLTLSLLSLCLLPAAHSQPDTLELEATVIKGNKELPKILYVVPWSTRQNAQQEEQNLQLHSLFGDLFDPVLPGQFDEQEGEDNIGPSD